MFQKFVDWLLGTKREERPYQWHRHRAWEQRELVGPDYIPPKALRWMKYPASLQAQLRNYKPIIRTGFGAGFGARQVEMWAWRKQRIYELRLRAARRKYLQETWGWMDLPVRELLDLWPRSGVASV